MNPISAAPISVTPISVTGGYRVGSGIFRAVAFPGWLVRLAGMVLLALLWRGPALAYQELNWDEALYRLIGGAMLQGDLPYVGLWDRKPVGLFAVVAAVQALFGPSLAAWRMTAAVSVGVGGFALGEITRRLVPRAPSAGGLAGVLWVLYSARAGGEGVNAELYFLPLNLLGLAVLLNIPARPASGRWGWAILFAAGLLFGMAAQVKTNAAVSWLAFAFLLARQGFAWRDGLPVLAGIMVPTLAVMGIYAGAGAFGAWWWSNAGSHLVVLGPALLVAAPPGEAASLPALEDIARQLSVYAVPLLATLAALAVARGNRVALAVWIAAEVVALLMLRRFTDHMVIQLLPPLCLGCALLVARFGRVAALGLLALLLAMDGRTMLRPFNAVAEIAGQRQIPGLETWGDPIATAGTGLAARMRPGETLYVFGGAMLNLYTATGRTPPTRFPFVEHLWKHAAPVDGVAEIHRILAGAPTWIAVSGRWAPDQPVPEPAAAEVFAAVRAALAHSYARAATIAPFTSQAGGPVGPRETIILYRLRGAD